MDPSMFAAAYSVSTSAGLRPFLTLAMASIAMHLGYLHPTHAFAYLGSDGATWLLGGLAVLEFGADKIPAVDHTLHVLHIATKPIAAALLVGAAIPDMGPGDAGTYALMGAGALNALGIHAGVATVRGASTVTTAGIANPFISLLEDMLAFGGFILAFAVPLLGAVLAIALTVLLMLAVRAVLRRASAMRSRATST